MNETVHKYADIFDDHMEIAKKKFIEKYGREPNIYEQLEEYKVLIEFFYD